MADVKKYSFSDVASRNGKGAMPLWIVYKDVIYDLTKYNDEHPGGPDSILEEAGKDATKAFDEVGHSDDAREIMKKYIVGEIVEEEKRYDANGKKKKRVVAAQPETSSRSCISMITCGLLG